MTRLKHRFLTTTRTYAKDTGGNFAIMMGFILFAFVGALACSIDMTNAFKTKSRLQDVTDVIALQAAKDKSLDTQAKLMASAQDYIDTHYSGAFGGRIVIDSITRTGDTVDVQATNNIDAYFAQIFGHDTLDVAVNSSATYAQRNVDIALVLDTTGSMMGGKISSLKTAANNLIDTLDEAENNKLKVSVVPFAKYVNVGLSRRNAIWLDVEDDYTETKEVCRNKRDLISRKNCRTVYGTCNNDGVPYSCSWKECDDVWSKPYEVCKMETKNHVWNGCVGSRTSPWHQRVDYRNHKIPGLMNEVCEEELQTLTNDMQAVKATINALKPRPKVKTYIPSGLMWGWRTLDTNEPLTEAVIDPRSETDKALILMTDGENTRSKSGVRHNGNDKSDADDVTKTMCEDIKNSDITVYTIAYEVDDASTKTMLSKCANDSSKYFDAQNASQLNAAFEQIADSLNELRLTN